MNNVPTNDQPSNNLTTSNPTNDPATGSESVQMGIFEKHWPVANSQIPKATVVIVHGLGEHCGRYGALAKALNTHGYAAAAIDLPGHGLSEGKQGHIDDFIDYHAAVLALVMSLRRQQPGTPLFILGHSMGGLIVSQMMLDHEQLFSGIVLSGPALKSSQQPPGLIVGLIRLISKFAPTLGIKKLGVTGLSRDPAVMRSYLQDPLVNKGKLSARFIAEMLKAVKDTLDNAADIRQPILIMHGTDDVIADPAGSKLLFNTISSKDKTLKLYPDLYHEIFNEPEAERVFIDLVNWLDQH